MDIENHNLTTDNQTPPNMLPNMLGELSHQLRVPLNTILGFASLMKDPELGRADREEFINRILSNGDQLLQLLDDAINLSKMSQKCPPLDLVSFNIVEMIYDVVQTLKPTAGKKELDIHLRFKTSIPQTITSDPIKVRQMINHILSNMIRSADKDGFILIAIAFDSGDQLQNLIIEIDDSGLHKSLEIPKIGFGLSEKFAQSLGGYLVARPSEIGDGNCFILSLPCGDLTNVKMLNKRKSSEVFKEISNGSKKVSRLKSIKVLLAEDSSDNETVIRLFLEKEGAVLSYAQNGLEAIEAVKSADFDVILMDIQMPLLDGLEATRQIRHLGFKKPIIALTGQVLRDDADKSLKAGCDTHLSKPVRKETLIQEIEKRISK